MMEIYLGRRMERVVVGGGGYGSSETGEKERSLISTIDQHTTHVPKVPANMRMFSSCSIRAAI
jgi:hypothetical protein